MSDFSPDDFLKCPNCHRKSVVMVMHLDGDVALECNGCDEMAIANPLNQNERVYGGENR